MLTADSHFERCAKQYAGYWNKGERPLFNDLASGDATRSLRAIQKAVGYFKIARNFPTSFDVARGIPRLAPVARQLEGLRTQRLTPETLCETIAGLRRRLAADYGGGDRLSAASKLLWLLRRDPVIIYDSQARAALGAPAGDYEAYVDLWRAGYEGNSASIARACATLEVEFHAAWFGHRVYDIYLWNTGAPHRAAGPDQGRVTPGAHSR